MIQRFRDNEETVYDFSDSFLVRCPSCENCAKIVVSDNSFTATASCTRCGWSKKRDDDSYSFSNDATDWYFGLPLWLQTSCCGEVLWARNECHLQHMKQFVGAPIRERANKRNPKNKSLISRYPKWLKLARNRSAILEGIARLEAKL